MELSPSAAQAISKFTGDLVAIDRKGNAEADATRIKYRIQMEPLFQQRTALLKGVQNYWSGVLSSPETPIARLLNGTTDPKVIRAITDFQVVSRCSGNELFRKFIFTFRTNMFVEAGEVSREVDTMMRTTSLQPLKWKSGTERARTDSFFAFLTADFPSDDGAMNEAVEALDVIYQDPFLAVKAD
ncbi:Nucleosome assembly protein (NAP) [Novymonas esmeraldas]|uniref:Nucleosome assembly protein (NAP) n=1 Tax=Novymonas esmeraldas TaxID=1808958 RepID=A0AAW0F3N4_9TRYP